MKLFVFSEANGKFFGNTVFRWKIFQFHICLVSGNSKSPNHNFSKMPHSRTRQICLSVTVLCRPLIQIIIEILQAIEHSTGTIRVRAFQNWFEERKEKLFFFFLYILCTNELVYFYLFSHYLNCFVSTY